MGFLIGLIVVVAIVGIVYYMNQQRSASSPTSYERSPGTAADMGTGADNGVSVMDVGSTTDTGVTTTAQARSYDAMPDAPNDVIGSGAVDGGGAKFNQSDALIGGIASNVQPEVSSGDDRPSYEKNN